MSMPSVLLPMSCRGCGTKNRQELAAKVFGTYVPLCNECTNSSKMLYQDDLSKVTPPQARVLVNIINTIVLYTKSSPVLPNVKGTLEYIGRVHKAQLLVDAFERTCKRKRVPSAIPLAFAVAPNEPLPVTPPPKKTFFGEIGFPLKEFSIAGTSEFIKLEELTLERAASEAECANVIPAPIRVDSAFDIADVWAKQIETLSPYRSEFLVNTPSMGGYTSPV